MVDRTKRRLQHVSVTVEVHTCGAESIPIADDSADGVVAVNSIQL